MFDQNEDIFALSGGKNRMSAQVFRGAERATKGLIRHYRRHSVGGKWSFAFVRLAPGETTPVSLTESVRPLFESDDAEGSNLRSGSPELSEWEARMTDSLMQLLSRAGSIA